MKALIINCSPVRNGATAEIVKMAAQNLSSRFETKTVCIDDYSIRFCKGCRECHHTAACRIQDDVPVLVAELDRADIILCVSPSYWADIPGQFKVFIDRCTPWCNTHEPHASLHGRKKGYSIVLRTGPGQKECDRIIQTLDHFYGHMEIKSCGGLGLCSIEHKEQVAPRLQEILDFCSSI
ncbi:MAG: flavodoxin family protein [Clostridia bacterium]|nr:flavodoxin family protein [Clostridia bacterium]